LKTVRYEAQVKHPHTPVRTWKHRAMITVCMTQNECGILEGFILHIMPRQKVISRTVIVMQYRIGAQYV